MRDTRVSSNLFLVEFHFRGVGKSLTHVPEERILNAIYRLSQAERNQLQYLKVRFYRLCSRLSAFRLRDKYVVPSSALPELEREFQEIYSDFQVLRRDIHKRLIGQWDAISERLRDHAARMGIDPSKVESLKPEGEDFIEIGYSLTPLPQLLNGILQTAEEFERLAKQRDEYRLLAQRMRREAEELRMSLEHQYDERIKRLEETIRKLKETSKTQAKTIYRLKLKARDYAAQAEELAPLLDDEAENLRFRLEALKEHLLGL